MSPSKKFTCTGTLRQVFIRVCRLEKHSVMLVFQPSFVNYCPSNLLSGSHPLPPPPFSVSKYSIYRQCVSGRGLGCWVLLETILCMSLTLCIWLDLEPTKLLDHPKQKSRMGGGLRQVNTFRKSHYKVNFLDDNILHFFSIRLKTDKHLPKSHYKINFFRWLHNAFLFYPSNLAKHPRKHGKSEVVVSVPEFCWLRA